MRKRYLDYIWMIIVVTIEFLQMEISCKTENTLVSMELKYVAINWIVICFINVFFLLAVKKIWISTFISGVLFTVTSVVNYYVILYHGMPLTVGELKNLKTALYVAGSYSYHISGIVLCILTCFLIISCISVYLKKRQIVLRRSISAGILIVCFGIIYVGFFSSNPIKPKVTVGWSWEESCKTYGYISYLVENTYMKEKGVVKPDHYNVDTVKRKYDEYKEDQSDWNDDLPDIILILNESFYDLHQIAEFQTDQDYLANINCVENMSCGYAVSPSIAGGTNGSEYELLTSNSLYLIKEAAPFNILDLEDSSSLAAYLKSLGYTTFGTHSEDGVNYNRVYGYSALGFDDIRFNEDYEDCWAYDKRIYKSDYSVYENVKKWYMQMEECPRFIYCLTIQNHGGWDLSPEEFDTIHVIEGNVEQRDVVNEYLTSISHSDEAFGDLIKYFETIVGRKVVVCMLGDHAPSFAVSLADTEYSNDERDMLLGATPLYIWANYELKKEDLGYMSMHYVAPILLDVAGVPLSSHYMYLRDIKHEVPIITAWGKYYDNDYVCYDIGTGRYSQTVDDYFSVEYNNIKGGNERITDFFKLNDLERQKE